MGVDVLLSHTEGMKHKANIKQYPDIQNFFCVGRKESVSNVNSSEEKSLKDSGGASVKITSEKFSTQDRVVTKPPSPQLMQSTVDKSMTTSDALKAEIVCVETTIGTPCYCTNYFD